jgi:hydroxymethylpyrimidine/phosphomethylpyrimidine kinase
VFEDIFPDAVKIGMVSSSALIEVIANKLVRYKATNIVVDPVLVGVCLHSAASDGGTWRRDTRLAV